MKDSAEERRIIDVADVVPVLYEALDICRVRGFSVFFTCNALLAFLCINLLHACQEFMNGVPDYVRRRHGSF